MKARVAVTAMGCWTPYGRGVDSFWQGLSGSEAATREVTRFSVGEPAYRTRKAAIIGELGDERSGAAEHDGNAVMLSVADDVLQSLGKIEVSPYDIAVMIGSSQNTSGNFQHFVDATLEGRAFQPRNIAWLSSAAILGLLSRKLDARGPAAILSTACASGTNAVGAAYDLICSGRARMAFAGGYGYFSNLSFSGFNILKLTAVNGCKPFDLARDGMALADGFALVALESEELARSRGATILAWVTGYACANEAYHATAPDPTGSAGLRVMWDALGRDAGRLDRLDYINAHGTGTVANDKAELAAIQRLLEPRTAPETVAVSSTKGHHGHSLGAAGGVEFVATVLALRNKAAPPNVGLTNPEPHDAKIDLVRACTPRPMRVALSNSFAFGGNVASVAVEAAS
jgi:3-oxoacyl-[acyl-carrier-protein] synthase II